MFLFVTIILGVARIDSVALRSSITSAKLTFTANPEILPPTPTQVPFFSFSFFLFYFIDHLLFVNFNLIYPCRCA